MPTQVIVFIIYHCGFKLVMAGEESSSDVFEINDFTNASPWER